MTTVSRKTTMSESHSRASYKRPKLLRSCATAPTLVTSYASRSDRSSPSSGINGTHSSSRDRATALLNRVASYSYCSEKSDQRKQVVNAEKRPNSSPRGGREGVGMDGQSKTSMQLVDGGKHGAYFSFPSFEDFEEFSEKEDSDTEMRRNPRSQAFEGRRKNT